MPSRPPGINAFLRPAVPPSAVVLALALAVLTLSACRTVPLEREIRTPIPVDPATTSTAEVDRAIWRAGRKQGWRMAIVDEGALLGTWRKSHYRIEVQLLHDSGVLTVRYLGSENLLEGDGEIHRAYPRQVAKLIHEIRHELTRLYVDGAASG